MTASNFDAALTVMLSVHNQELKEFNDNCARPAIPEPMWEERASRVVKALDGLVREGRNIRSGKYTFPADATVECIHAVEGVHLLPNYEREYDLMRNLLYNLRDSYRNILSRHAAPSVNTDLLDGAGYVLYRQPFPFPEVYNGIE